LSGLERGVISAVMAVAPRAGRMGDLYPVRGHTETLGDALAQGIDALAVSIECEPVIPPFCQRRRWGERAVHLVGALVGGSMAGCRQRCGEGGIQWFALNHRQAGARGFFQAGEDVVLRQAGASVPVAASGEVFGGLDGGVFPLPGDGEEAAVADDADILLVE
jgi:hypothetical protein